MILCLSSRIWSLEPLKDLFFFIAELFGFEGSLWRFFDPEFLIFEIEGEYFLSFVESLYLLTKAFFYVPIN